MDIPAKAILTFIGGVSAGSVVKTFASSFVQPQSMITKITIPVGSFVLGSMVSDAAETHISKKYDEYAAKWTEYKTKTDSK